MKFLNSLQTAINGLKANKTRSALTMLGIIIGIASVIIMMSLGQGAQNLIIGQIISTGSNTIFIEPGSLDKTKSRGMMDMMEKFEIQTLKIKDAEAIQKDPNVEIAAPLTFGVSRVVYQSIDKRITYMGVTPNALEINNTYSVSGRLLTDTDVKITARVAVLGHKVKQDLFGDEDPLGKTIRIKKINFKIIGVAQEQGTQMFQNLDENIYIPITTAQKLLLGISHVRWITAKAINEEKVDEAVEGIRLILRETHNIYNPEGNLGKDDFKVMSQKETAEMLTIITNVLTIFLSSVAAIALLVGGIGIMNIMLVSVTERTREIGLRKAVGARKKDILEQFLIEAVILTVMGGLIGTIVGIIGSYLGCLIIKSVGIDWVFFISLPSIALAFGVAAITGLIFGIVPARKAANLSPIEALRYE